jgi:hypothetical protein
MDFKVDFGPWETVFLGQTYGHEVEIFTNPENFFLVFIYDKRDGKRVGSVVEGYKAFFARGAMDTFIQTIPKPCFGVAKSMGDKTGKIFFLSFDPFYVDFKQDDFVRRIDLAIQKTEENSSMIIDLARASSLELKDLSNVAKTEYAPILGDPFTIKTLIAGRKQSDLAKVDISTNNRMNEETQPMIQLGLSKTREIIKEAIINLKRTQIIGEGNPLNYSMYIISENLLLENIPIVIFDSEDYFAGLGTATSDSVALKDEMVDFEPLGFPIKNLNVKDSIKISLKDVDLYFLLEMLGLGDEEFQKNLSLISFTMRVNTPIELLEKIAQTKELNDYEKLRAERLINIVNKSFNNLFGEAIPASELTRAISGKMGRAMILNMKTLNTAERILFTHTIMRQITKGLSETQQVNCSLIIPNLDELFMKNQDKAITAITRLENRGVGFVIGSSKELPDELAKTMTAKMNVVAGKDLAVSIKGKRNYRVNFRPNLSGTPKL